MVIFVLTLFAQFDELIGLTNKYIFDPLVSKLAGLSESPTKLIILAAIILIMLAAFFLLRKKLPPVREVYEYTLDSKQKVHIFFKLLILFGCINFILVSVLLVKEYKPLLTFVQLEQNNYLASQQVKEYVNTQYNYSIKYPQN